MATPSAANGRIAKLLLKRTTSNTAVAPGPFHIFPPLKKKKCKEATHPKQTSALLCTGGATFKKKIEETLLILKQKAA